MNECLFDLNNLRLEISFKSLEQLRSILSLYQKNGIYKVNIPCKNGLKKAFLLDSIKISREEFPDIDIIPHYSILHEFERNRLNTIESLITFLDFVKSLGCKQVLLVSGSQKRKSLDSVSALNFISNNHLFSNNDFAIGIAFNPYLPDLLFEEEIIRLEKKLQSGLVKSVWIQFGTDLCLLETRIKRLKDVIYTSEKSEYKKININLFGSILIPSKQFLARFKFRPWKGVYCSLAFLESLDFAKDVVRCLQRIYLKYNIYPLIETGIYTENSLNSLKESFSNDKF